MGNKLLSGAGVREPGTEDIAAPAPEALRAAVAAFTGATAASATSLAEDARTDLDPALRDHRRELLRWLNSWGCRLRYPRPGETDLFEAGVRDWWALWAASLPAAAGSLAELTDPQIDAVAGCFGALAAVPVGAPERPRPLGPTAASKLLYRLRPQAVMPWDEAIARRLHGARDAVAFAAHQRLGRSWARHLLATTGLDERAVASELGGAGRSLAKILDDYCYVRFTRAAEG
ncbi:hypothetical protein [Streptomyces sp. NPDC018045]|uniref:hypothetical protein n=1 Tax=Streptomyces sp. NPDC018045 TaxID=3365037 RepID=UPI0037B79EA4